jgi:hypothetical protein
MIRRGTTFIYFLRFNNGGGILVHSYLARELLLRGHTIGKPSGTHLNLKRIILPLCGIIILKGVASAKKKPCIRLRRQSGLFVFIPHLSKPSPG